MYIPQPDPTNLFPAHHNKRLNMNNIQATNPHTNDKHLNTTYNKPLINLFPNQHTDTYPIQTLHRCCLC